MNSYNLYHFPNLPCTCTACVLCPGCPCLTLLWVMENIGPVSPLHTVPGNTSVNTVDCEKLGKLGVTPGSLSLS